MFTGVGEHHAICSHAMTNKFLSRSLLASINCVVNVPRKPGSISLPTLGYSNMGRMIGYRKPAVFAPQLAHDFTDGYTLPDLSNA
jgi:hypothetical protein